MTDYTQGYTLGKLHALQDIAPSNNTPHNSLLSLTQHPESLLMLTLSEILLQEGDEIHTFEALKTRTRQRAVESDAIFFQVDIEPPAYDDRPENWYEQLEITFQSAR